MDVHSLLLKALRKEELSLEEGVFLYNNARITDLSFVANEIRKTFRTDNKVTWIIDRNVNITNVCVSLCKFCNFYTKVGANNSYVTTINDYSQKIKELEEFGGEQLLIQGGHNPKLGIDFYKDLFSQLKERHPNIKLHALGPPEIHYIAQKAKLSYYDTLVELKKAGLDSLPGAGAEILSNDVRKRLSPGKCSADEWLEVMRQAHKLKLTTSATMMFNHLETVEDRIEHLIKLRNLQSVKPEDSEGFTAFIPWPFCSENTELDKTTEKDYTVNHLEYIKIIAISRIMLTNIKNIQASWLTVGIPTAQICLHSGANDMGSIMIEENVVSQAGAKYKVDKFQLAKAIEEAGFEPQLRNQAYEYI